MVSSGTVLYWTYRVLRHMGQVGVRAATNPEPAQHSTAQHSTAQHSTAQHLISSHLISSHLISSHLIPAHDLGKRGTGQGPIVRLRNQGTEVADHAVLRIGRLFATSTSSTQRGQLPYGEYREDTRRCDFGAISIMGIPRHSLEMR